MARLGEASKNHSHLIVVGHESIHLSLLPQIAPFALIGLVYRYFSCFVLTLIFGLPLATRHRHCFLHRNKRTRIVELVPAAFAAIPHVKSGLVGNDLALRVQFHVGTVHGPRRRPFKIDSFRRVAAAVAGALEFVFRRLPIRSAAQVRALGKDRENLGGLPHHVDSILLLEPVTDTQHVIRRVAQIADCAGLKEGARKKEAQEHQEIRGQKCPNTSPGKAPAQ